MPGPGDASLGPGSIVEVDLGPGVRAAFTTRAGGVSRGPWAALDLGLHVDDDPDAVRANRRTVGRWLGAEPAFATQVHGRDVVVVNPGSSGADTVGEFDALVGRSGTAVGVLVADCVPVLLADAEAGVVAAVHAGRRGVLAGVVGAALDAMAAAGADRSRVRAAVGPAVCGRCYEVPDAMRDEVAATVPATWATTRAGTPALDLPAGVAAQLAAAGVTDVHLTGLCTMEDDRFYSHRRDGGPHGRTGRFAGVVVAGRDTPGVSARRPGAPGLA